jgi:glycosyltransferase involved in cell wall biosynthesis
MPGGVGGGHYSQGIPVIARLVEDISRDYTVTIYSLYPPNPDFKCIGFKMFSIHKAIQVQWLRWMLLYLLFFIHNANKKYKVVYSFWGFPSGFIAVSISKLIRIPSIIHLQGGDTVYLPSIKYGSMKGLNRKLILWTYRNCSVLIALSDFQKNKLIEVGFDRDIIVIPFGVDVNLFKPKPWKKLLNPIHFLHVGNLVPVKDQLTLINTFDLIAKEREAKLRIIGGDYLDGQIQKHCFDLGLEQKVEFLPMQPYEEMPVHYNWADVLLITSMYEGQCLAINEAAANGVMIAGTRTGILSDWGDSCGVIVEIGDAERLAKEVISRLRYPETIRELTINSITTSLSKDRVWTAKEVCECIRKTI